MRRFLAQLMVFVVLAFAGTAMAAELDAPPRTVGVRANTPLFVELIVNGRITGDIVSLRMEGDAMFVDKAALRKAGLLLDGAGELDVAHMPGIKAKYDVGMQQIIIEAGPEYLPVSRIESDRPGRSKTHADLGFLLNYDAYVATGAGKSASVASEQRVFGPLGLASNTGVLRLSKSGGASNGYLRYDTYARVIDENHAVAYTAGDFITQSLPWSRSVRMGGVQASRAFRVRPDLVTMPLPSFAGETAVPSAVDLFVNGYKQQSNNVQPGRFVLDSIPVVNGAGEATIITTDAVGRQISTTIPFYVTPTLLKHGLLDFSVEAGALRRNYGIKNFDYGPGAASGVVRYGLTNHLTLEGHTELAQGFALAGAGMAWSPGRIGVFTASATTSRTGNTGNGPGGMGGSLWTVGYEYNTRRFSFVYNHEQRGGDFRDLGDFFSANGGGAHRMDRFIGSVSLGQQGSIGLAYFDGKTLGAPDSRIATASYQRPLGRRATLLAAVDRDFERKATSAQLRVVVPFGRNSYGAAVTHTDGRTRSELNYARSMPSQGGLGIDAAFAADDRGQTYGQGTLTWRNHDLELQTGASMAAGAHTAWASATGSVIFMGKGVYTANRVTDAFALVDTGLKDVGIFYENQRVGRTDKHGKLFVPQVISYQNATFALDALALPADVVAQSVKQQMAVREGGGAMVKMPVRLVQSIMAALVDRDGKPIAAGSHVTLADGREADIGYDGLVYLEDVKGKVQMDVSLRGGGACRVTFDVKAGAKALSKIGPLQCV